jgi:hypothetical protein
MPWSGTTLQQRPVAHKIARSAPNHSLNIKSASNDQGSSPNRTHQPRWRHMVRKWIGEFVCDVYPSFPSIARIICGSMEWNLRCHTGPVQDCVGGAKYGSTPHLEIQPQSKLLMLWQCPACVDGGKSEARSGVSRGGRSDPRRRDLEISSEKADYDRFCLNFEMRAATRVTSRLIGFTLLM